jgi:hypothetical protein
LLHRSPRWKAEPDRRREVLDRHDVCLAEWLVLTEVARGGCNSPPGLPARSAAFAVRDFGVPVTEEQCRAAMDGCLAKGWLRVIDRRAEAEIDDLLRQAPAAAPLASGMVPCLGEVDFMPGGAALHQAVSEEFLGPAWADGLCVRRELEREEHRYGETEQDIHSALEECDDRGEQVVS